MLYTGPTFSNSDERVFDICDGRVYKSFKDKQIHLFFADKRNLGVMMNFDFFNPYKNTEYSLGLILFCYNKPTP